MPAVTRVLNVPDTPPKAWFTDDSPDFVMGQTLRVVTSGPDEGRAFGLIQPPPAHSAYLPGRNNSHRNRGRRPPDARLYPDGMAVFNRGTVEVTGDNGEVTSIAAGHLPLYGGHAGTAVGAVNIGEALEWLHREGRWTAQADALGLVGVASPVEDPTYAGAVMFRGAAIPGMTLREAQTVNATSVSAEVWSDPQYGNQLVFAGAVRVDHTAWPYHEVPDQLAAEAGEGGRVFCLVYPHDHDHDHDDSGGGGAVEGVTEIDDGAPMAHHQPTIATTPLIVHPPTTAGAAADMTINVGAPEPVVTTSAATATVIAAETDDPGAMAALTGRVDDHDKAIEDQDKKLGDLEVEIAELALTVFGGENLGALNEMEGITRRLHELEATIERLADTAETAAREAAENPQAAANREAPRTGLTAPSTAGNLAGALRG